MSSAVLEVKLYEPREEGRFGSDVGAYAEEKGAVLTVLFNSRQRFIHTSRARGVQARAEIEKRRQNGKRRVAK